MRFEFGIRECFFCKCVFSSHDCCIAWAWLLHNFGPATTEACHGQRTNATSPKEHDERRARKSTSQAETKQLSSSASPVSSVPEACHETCFQHVHSQPLLSRICVLRCNASAAHVEFRNAQATLQQHSSLKDKQHLLIRAPDGGDRRTGQLNVTVALFLWPNIDE